MLGENLLPIGTISKSGSPVNGKQAYELKDEQRNKKYTFTVPEENIDSFEKLYEENNNIAQEINNPEVQEKLRQKGFDFGKKLKTVTTIGTISGAVIPAVIAICTKGKIWKRALFGTLSSLVGAALGAWGSTFIGVRIGLRGIFKADENVKKMDEIAKQVDALGVERKVETIV